MNCPHCTTLLENVFLFNTEWQAHRYYDYCTGYCPICKKHYNWVEVYILDRTEITEEFIDEDEDK